MWDKMFSYILENHRGKAIGLLLGLIAGIMVISYGFWKTLFIFLCIIGGFLIGKAVDEQVDFDEWIKKVRGKQ